MENEIKEKIKSDVLARMDLSGEIHDEDVNIIINESIDRETSGMYIPVREKLRLRSDIFNSIRRMDILSELLEDDTITEIMINGFKDIFYEKDGRIVRSEKVFDSPERLMTVVQQMVGDANRMVNESSPIVDVILRDGSRVNVVLSGISVDGTAVTIRKFPQKILDMKSLIELDALSEEVAGFLGLLVRAGYNLFISGGTGAGKTTFMGALTEFIPEEERVVTIEDSAELRVKDVPNLVRLEARNANVEGKNMVTIRDLVKCSLRMRPDRIIVGEVRDAVAIDMLQAMNTGHDGSLSTGHANSAHEMLERLEAMVLMGAELPLKAVRQQIASALDIVVHLGRLRDRSRKILEVREVVGMENEEIVTREIYRFVETDIKQEKVVGELRKMNDLLNVNKLINAGCIDVYQERYV